MIEINKNLILVTDYSKEIGFGHLSRMMAIYDAFKDRDIPVIIIIDEENLDLNLLGNRKYKRVHWHFDITLLDEYFDSPVILDSLVATQSQVDYLSSKVSKFIVIDDFCRRSYANALIIDWTPNAENKTFHMHNLGRDNTFLFGIKYAILRSPFLLESNYQVRDLKEITIVMGGTDIRGLSYSIAQHINTKFPNIHINLISQQKIDFCNSMVRVYPFLSAEKIKDLFLRSDIVITAAGQTLFELLSLRIPTIPICVASNQLDDLNGFVELGFFDKYLSWDSDRLNDEVEEFIMKIQDIEIRQKINKLNFQINNSFTNLINGIISFINEGIRK